LKQPHLNVIVVLLLAILSFIPASRNPAGFQILTLIIAFFILAGLRGFCKIQILIRNIPGALPLLLLGLWAVFSCVFSTYPGGSLEQLPLTFLPFLWLCLFAILHRENTGDKTYGNFLSVANIIVVVCLLHFLIVFLPVVSPGKTGLSFGLLHGKSAFPNPDQLAGFASIGVIISFGLSLFLSRIKVRIIYFVLFVILCAGIVATHSRGAIIACAIAILTLPGRKWGWRAVAAGLVVLTTLFVCLPSDTIITLAKAGPTQTLSFARFGIWKSTLQMIADYPVVGVGPGNFGLAFHQYNIPLPTHAVWYGISARFAHNEYLHVASCLGIPGLALFIWGIIAFYRSLHVVIARNSNMSLRGQHDWPKQSHTITNSHSQGEPKNPIFLPIIAESVLTVVLVQALFDFNLHMPVTMLTALFIISLSWNASPHTPYPGFCSQRAWEANKLFLASISSGVFVLCIWLLSARLFAVAGYPSVAGRINPLSSDFAYQAGTIERSIQLNPYQPDVWRELAMSHARAGKDTQASRTLEKATEANPKNALLWYELGIFKYRTGDANGALKALRQALLLEPNFLRAWAATEQIARTSGLDRLSLWAGKQYQMACWRIPDLIRTDSNYERQILLPPPIR